MEIDVRLSEKIINQSLRLHYAHAPAKQRYSILYVPVALVFVAIFLLAGEWNKHMITRNIWLGILYAAMGTAYYFYMSYRREHTGRQLMKSLGENSHFQMEVTDHELVTKLADSTLNHQWNAFHRAVCNDQLILLYQPNQSFSMYHDSFFADGDFQRFRRMVKDHVIVVKEV